MAKKKTQKQKVIKQKRKQAAGVSKVEDPKTLELMDAYQKAVSQGKGQKFLKDHPVFAKKATGSVVRKGGGTGINKINAESTAKQVIAASRNEGNLQNQMATSGQNLGQYSTGFGSTSGGFNPATGRYEIAQNESDAQRAIREGGEGLRTTGQGLAQQNLQNYNAFNWQGSPEERARIEQEVYGRLTRNVDRDFNQEFDALEQRMYNRGIPLDPTNPAYKREMDALNEKYANIKENAQSQAVQMGGEEMMRSYGIGLGSQQQRMAETGQLQGYGMDYQGAPQLDFNPSEYMQTNPADVYSQQLAAATNRYATNKNYAASIYGADKVAATAAANREASQEEEVPT